MYVREFSVVRDILMFRMVFIKTWVLELGVFPHLSDLHSETLSLNKINK
jgi:hypothetical protein